MKKRTVSMILIAVLVVMSLTAGALAEPLKITWAGTGSTLFPTKDSYILQKVNEKYGIEIEPIAVNCGKAQEMTLLFASGIVPDHMQVIPASMQGYIDEGLVRSISMDTLKKYPALYKMVMRNQPFLEQLPVYDDGKLYGIPAGDQPLFPLTMVRTDWLEAVGMEMPTNLVEFEEMCRRFTFEDPDGNGVDDTYAMYINGSAFYYIFAAFGVSPYVTYSADDQWILDADGKAVKATVSEQYRNALRYIANLNAKGYLHPDAAATDNEKNAFFTNGTVGMITAAFNQFIVEYSPSGAYALLYQNEPDARCDYLPALTGENGEIPVFGQNRSVWRYSCFGYETSDEKVDAILSILNDQIADPTFGDLIWRGVENEHFTVDETGMAILSPDWKSSEKQAELGCKFLIFNSRDDYQMKLSYGEERVAQEAFQKDWVTLPPLFSPGTTWPEKTEYNADCITVEEEFFYNVATGVWDVDEEWDNYLARWNSVGGDKMTQGANALLK